jgi:hypothetical protein
MSSSDYRTDKIVEYNTAVVEHGNEKLLVANIDETVLASDTVIVLAADDR